MTEKKKIEKKKIDWSFYASVAVGIGTALVLLQFFSLVDVNGSSMADTFHDGDKVVCAKHSEIQYGDVVVCKSDDYSKVLIKRVIGMEHDVIDIDFETGTVCRNQEALDEPYLKEKPFSPLDDAEEWDYPVTVPDGCYMVMGDNRNHSLDSRAEEIGFIQESSIYGKVILRYYPLSQFTTDFSGASENN